ncbi:unnamed protein product, partial [Mesorhabditis belari]|uniref:Uncharacterized protein n=1 Tax=Mesorhabditis belari TaxID=2138241 RepID=A0AAF3EJK3_9BILA
MRSIFFLFLAFALICVIVADDKAQGDQRVRRDDDREKRSMPKDPQGDQRGLREREKREGYGYRVIRDDPREKRDDDATVLNAHRVRDGASRDKREGYGYNVRR